MLSRVTWALLRLLVVTCGCNQSHSHSSAASGHKSKMTTAAYGCRRDTVEFDRLSSSCELIKLGYSSRQIAATVSITQLSWVTQEFTRNVSTLRSALRPRTDAVLSPRHGVRPHHSLQERRSVRGWKCSFFTRDSRMLSILAMAQASVCLSVTLLYCIKTVQAKITMPQRL